MFSAISFFSATGIFSANFLEPGGLAGGGGAGGLGGWHQGCILSSVMSAWTSLVFSWAASTSVVHAEAMSTAVVLATTHFLTSFWVLSRSVMSCWLTPLAS